MHLETVFCLVGIDRHGGEAGGSVEFVCDGLVEDEIAEGRLVVGALRESAAGEVVMVGGSEEEDTLAAWLEVSIRPEM